MIRLSFPSIEEDDLMSVIEVLETGYMVQGKNVSDFEKLIAEYTGSSYAVAVSSCTAALHLSLLALDIQPNDIVLLPAYSWISTANVIELCRARPYFIDILPDTFNIDPSGLKTSLDGLMADSSVSKKIKAILAVHCFGQMADITKIIDIAEGYNIPVIEDAACALGASLNGKQAGAFGTTGCFSFHPRKAITTGEGGIITVNNSKMTQKLKSLRNHGIGTIDDRTDFILPGFNYRMTDFQGALGLTQFHKIERIINSRRQQASFYNQLLRNTLFQIPYVRDNSKHVYQSYIVLLPNNDLSVRNNIIKYLKKHGVEVTIGTINMPMTFYYKNRYAFKSGEFPVTDNISNRSISLPIHEKLSSDNQRFIVKYLLKGLERFSH